ncbi:MAG: outer membrane beta-barrel domain-containing protein [Cellvibrionaceae bacterium]
MLICRINFLHYLSLVLCSLFLSAAVTAQGSGSSVKIIEPKKDVKIAKSAAIDDEKFELGLFTGILAVDEFNDNPVYGISFSYHMTPKFLLQLNYGESETRTPTFEKNATPDPDNPFLTDSQRTFEYVNLLAGYRVLRGRSFFGRNSKYNSDIYLMFGVDSVDFAQGSSNTGIVIGTSYRVVLTDSLTMNVDFRGHAVDREFNILSGAEGNKESTFNTELIVGLNLLF